MPKAAAICTVFDRAAHLLRLTFQSILDSADSDMFHWIVVDDGCREPDLEQIVAKMQLTEQLSFEVIRFDTKEHRPNTHQNEKGHNNPAFAFNMGIKRALELGMDYIFFYSSDIVFEPLCLTRSLNYFEKLGDSCLHAYTFDRGSSNNSHMVYSSSTNPRPLGWWWGTASKNIKAVAIGVDQWYDEEFLRGFAFEDGDFTYRVAKAAGHVVVDDSIQVRHQWHPSNYDDPIPNIPTGSGHIGIVANRDYSIQKWGRAEVWNGAPIEVADRRPGYIKIKVS